MMNHVTSKVRSIRLYVPNVGARPILGSGILVLSADDLVLIVDDENNDGASATNAMEEIIGYLEEVGIASATSNFVELDSMGFFDEVEILGRTKYAKKIGWNSLRFGEHTRTIEAFTGKYGEKANEIIRALSYENSLDMISA